MFKRITLLVLITATVLLAYNVAFASLWWCDGASSYCQSPPQNCYFTTFNCEEYQPDCNWDTKCEFVCIFCEGIEDFGDECCER